MRKALAFVCLLHLQTIQAQVVGHLQENLPRFKLIARFQGGIADQNPEALLLHTYDGAYTLSRYDLASRTLSVLGPISSFSRSFLIPDGYLHYTTNGLSQVEGAEEIILGPAELYYYEFGLRSIEGRFGVLRLPEGRVLRDFVARTNMLLSTGDGFTDVSANGTVAFTEHLNGTNILIRAFRNGAFETLATLPGYPLPYIATDGTNVLWSELESYIFGNVYLQTPTERILLSTETGLAESGIPQQFPPLRINVAMKNGWTVFPRRGPGNPGSLYNLWRRSPTGEISQLTTSAAFVYAMADDGSVLRDGAESDPIPYGLIYDAPGQPPKSLGYGGAPLARFFASGNKYYVYSPLQSGGLGLFEVIIDSDPFDLVFPSFNAETGKFTVTLLPGTLGTYILERTTDFVEWTAIHTIDLELFHPPLIEVATSPGFFRLRKP
jgi:hypothetical protein